MTSSLGRIETVPLGDRTMAAIRAAIITGELAGGTPLSDRELSESLGVSRTPVREALHRLKEAGLVEPRGRTGWAVAHFTEKDVREIFQLRVVLEPVGLEELERTGDPARIRALSRFFEDYAHPIDVDRYGDYFAEDQRFHRAIVACSGNSRLQHFYDVIEGHINRGRHFLLGAAAGRVEETLDEHLGVARAIGEGDFARARSELLLHLRTGEELMIKQLRQRG
ncbi:GntR family transcriptional regulator [Serinicoccus kebangsaanensis]|uniref:GntR family transcriptional regulator n=1 Tax=Serinicoccus kebangsaanensis TaxID=2602069 RepID=UPI00124CB630|nr:GntR family transcriptional regulator [Serinicoccus kebangsaanensis]